ncbi:MAG: DUF3536 domain-containing protein [Anaerolineaceae bacterium]|nr:DUF3536 domain-containing protein [Anaerolineaceae bacterium]
MDIHTFCIHGHFYQPPREDPLTGEIPYEPGSAPYHNWNERIYYECYNPNVELGNFKRISFNIGPTLSGWMDRYDPSMSQRVVAQDQANMQEFGAGNAMAQAYNHTILPLATHRDKVTQVLWGIADFKSRFGRTPHGMWLPETAVDLETLQVMADCGIEFTILAPWQSADRLAFPNQPGVVHLADGKKLNLFFYDQELSTRISFDPSATINADAFVAHLLSPRFTSGLLPAEEPSMILAASDGELYGHHLPFREKFLAYLMDGALTGKDFSPVFPELWLQRFPARQTVQIVDNTSWSCHHGIARWSTECGCTERGRWKAPLRKALNLLADQIDQVYEKTIGTIFPDPWELRNRYIHVVLGEANLAEIAGQLAGRRLDTVEERKTQLMLQAQYERQRMFTSCGWFFEDFDRIEPKNNVAYAAQAVWLTRLASGLDLTGEALRLFHPVKSDRTGLAAGAVFSYYIHRAQAAFSGFGPAAAFGAANASSSFPT